MEEISPCMAKETQKIVYVHCNGGVHRGPAPKRTVSPLVVCCGL